MAHVGPASPTAHALQLPDRHIEPRNPLKGLGGLGVLGFRGFNGLRGFGHAHRTALQARQITVLGVGGLGFRGLGFKELITRRA